MLQFLPELRQCSAVGLSLNFNITVGQVPDEAVHSQPVRRALREIAVTDTLYSTANYIAFGAHDLLGSRLCIVPGGHTADNIQDFSKPQLFQHAAGYRRTISAGAENGHVRIAIE